MAASEWMLPARALGQIEIDRDLTKQQQLISEFARPRNLSHTMVAYRLLKLTESTDVPSAASVRF